MSTATLTDNATAVAKLYEAFGRGDINFIVANLADDCTWIGAGEGSLPQGGTYHGKDAANFFKKLLENEDFSSFNPVSINNIKEDEVVAFGDMSTTSKVNGQKIWSEWTMHFKFNDDGKVTYFHDFFDTAAAYIATQSDGASSKQQNISLVKKAYDDFLSGNIQGVLDKCTDNIEWGSYDNPTVPYAGTFNGKAGAAEFFKTLRDSVEYSRFEPQDFYADGNKVFVKGYHQGKATSTGKTFGHPFLMEFTLRDGKVARFFAYVDSFDQAQAFQS